MLAGILYKSRKTLMCLLNIVANKISDMRFTTEILTQFSPNSTEKGVPKFIKNILKLMWRLYPNTFSIRN